MNTNNVLVIILMLCLALCISCDQDPKLDSSAKPDANRFSRSALTKGMDEPMAMDFLPEERIIIVERKGDVKIFDESTGAISLVTHIPVNTKYTNKEGRVREAEEGLMGVIADPGYEENNWIYMYYADPDEPKHVLARWELKGLDLDSTSKIVVLEVPTQREECCHTGGGMDFDKNGNLYLTVGNNTVNPRSGASNMDERLGYENSDDQRGPSNSNDLRGKILRIHPEKDGSYSIPEGNLFPEGTEKTRPEIYTMGHRNPWRVSVDDETGFIYWGEVGPDANKDSIWGPRGYDEFNQAKKASFHGWPYFVGNNIPYHAYDAENETYGASFDVENVVNNSVNNTGVTNLPKPVPAFISYPYGPSEDFPKLGSSGRSATGGPVYRSADFADAARPFPTYYEGKWLIVDFMRDWIMSVTMNENGDYESMERFLPNQNFSAAIDMDFGPSGDLYVLEYGDAWFRKNSNSQLVKLEFNAGNRKPNVMATADRYNGAIPFDVQFSSEGTNDYDDYDSGKLSYKWEVSSENGVKKVFKEANPKMTFDQAGIYDVSLTVTDKKKATNETYFEIVAGNEAPVVSIDFKGANRSFYFGDPKLDYAIAVMDNEDGSTADGSIKLEETAITFDYIPEGFDPIDAASNQSGAELLAIDAIGRNLIEQNDCKSCHQYDKTSIGPSYKAVSEKYENNPDNRAMLEDRVINGSTGIWGEHAMAAHPELTEDHAKRMVHYIMTFTDLKPSLEKLAMEGSVVVEKPEGEEGYGTYVLRASYEDKGGEKLSPLRSEAILALRSPIIVPQDADGNMNVQNLTTPRKNFHMLAPKSHLQYSGIDLTNIEKIEAVVVAGKWFGSRGGNIEVRIDSPDGILIGQSEPVLQVTPPPRAWGGNSKPPITEAEKKARRRRGHQEIGIDLKPTQGMHDVYLVFVNPEANENEILMSVKEIEFYRRE